MTSIIWSCSQGNSGEKESSGNKENQEIRIMGMIMISKNSI